MMLTASSGGPQTVTIPLMDDNVLEDREYFTLQLFSTDSRVTILRSTATVWIMDDDSKKVASTLYYRSRCSAHLDGMF